MLTEDEMEWIGAIPKLSNIRGGRQRRPVLKCDDCLQSLPACLSKMPVLLALRLFSENGK